MKNKKKFSQTFFLKSKPTTKKLSKLFKPDITDFVLFIFKLSITLTIWIITSKRFGFSDLFSFWEIPINACVIGFDIHSNDDPFYVLLGTPLKQIQFPHKGYYIYLKICSVLAFGNVKNTLIISVIFVNFFLVFLFRRLLIVYKIGKNDVQLTCFFCMFPTTAGLFHAIPTFDSFLFCIICLSLILYKCNSHILSLVCCFYACLIRFEGIFLPFSLLISSILYFDIGLIFMYFVITIICYLMLIKPYNFKEYMIPGQEPSSNYLTYPFKMCIEYISTISELMRGNTYIVANIVIGYTIAILILKAFPLGILSLCHLLLFNSISHPMPFRFLLPASSIATICGFESIISHRSFKPLSVIFLPVYLYLLFYLSTSLVESNQTFKIVWQSLFS